ncbi:hypothetical protein Tco_0105255 [Tanacetum coccineum]
MQGEIDNSKGLGTKRAGQKRHFKAPIGQEPNKQGIKHVVDCSTGKGSFYTENLKKCHADEPLAVPLDGLHLDDKLQFVKEPLEIVGREVKRLKRSRIPLVKVRWNSKRGPEFMWEREDQFKKKHPHSQDRTIVKCCIVASDDLRNALSVIFGLSVLKVSLSIPFFRAHSAFPYTSVTRCLYHSLHPSGNPPFVTIPLRAPSTSRRADIPEADTPPRKETTTYTPQPGSDIERMMMTRLRDGIGVSYPGRRLVRESSEFHSRHHDAQKDRAAVRAEIEVLRRERLAYEQESMETRQALARSEAHCRQRGNEITVLED